VKAGDARVVLTGATGGIGQSAAEAFVGAGASVMLAGRSPVRLAMMARRLAAMPGAVQRVQWCVADLDEQAGVQGLAGAAADWGCNVLVHGAGMPSFGPLESEDSQAMPSVLRTNLLAPMLLTHALLPHLRKQRRAQILFVGSVLGRIGLPGFSVYSASKFGLRGFAEALRRELAGTPVRVQYFGPRSTRTAFNSPGVEAYNRDTGTAMDTPAHVAAAMVRMLEDECAERFLGFPEKLGVRINGLAPTWLDRSFKRHSRSLALLSNPPTRASPHDRDICIITDPRHPP
jgi:short-subunit dehydrogenase